MTAEALGVGDMPGEVAFFQAHADAQWLRTLECTTDGSYSDPSSASTADGSIGSNGSSANWAGFANSNVPIQTTTNAQWRVPSIDSFSGSTAAVWVGQGGVNGQYLAQSGTWSRPGLAPIAWWEIYPQTPIYQISNLPVSVGDKVNVDVVTRVDNQTIQFDYCNESATPEVCANFTEHTNSPIGHSAEWIVERTSSGSDLTPLAHFKIAADQDYEQILNPKAIHGSTIYTPGSTNSTAFDMRSCDGNTLLANTGIWHASDALFNVAWDNHGSTEPRC